jgi:hypothetical protein
MVIPYLHPDRSARLRAVHWRLPGRSALAVALLLPIGIAGRAAAEEASRSAGGDRPASLEEWKEHRARLDRTVWAEERLAQEHEATIVALWDALLEAARRGDEASKRAALASVPFDELRVGSPRTSEEIELGIERQLFGPPERRLDPAAWRKLLDELAAAGYRLVQSDWHHARFTPAKDGSPARSQVSVNLHVLDAGRERRIAVEGELAVEWSGRRDAKGNPIPAKIDATGLRMLVRSGPVAFERIASFEWPAAGGLSRVHPVLVYDLDRDGRSEIVALGAGRALWNLGGGRFRDVPLVDHPYAFAETGVVADLDGDGSPDLLAARARGDLVLYRGDPKGRFREEPRATPRFPEPLRAPSAITVGDVDADGDLDAWLAQYEPAYRGGQMPTPFYDANDGHPSYLLRNDGKGGFEPATEAAGLAAKRFRRTYASAFADLDEDGDLDLLVVSDYAGVDLHENDGRGRFRDADHTLHGADRHLFGMSASLADFDLDGRLDFFVAGMASTTARRLEALGLGRPDRPDLQEMRMRMAFGNRMYLAGPDGWREPEFREQVARTGWTWGTTALDFDNDGDRDLFAANGHASGESTRDYCSTFWTHDIYDGASQPDPALAQLFAEIGGGVAKGAESWDGYQKNHLLVNRSGKGFVNVAFLLGVADEFDSRSALSDDLDQDGRMDLVVVEDHGGRGQRLHVYRNRLETGNAWIAVRLEEEGGGVSPVGAKVVVRTPEQTHVGQVVTGETLMGQHPTTLHFGLGRSRRVESIEVRWVGGRSRLIRDPEPGRVHLVRPAR